MATKPVNTNGTKLNDSELKFWKDYSAKIANGTADRASLGWYNAIAKRSGWKQGTISNQALQQMSIRALGGDAKAQQYLKDFHYNALTGESLWKGFNPNDLSKYNQNVINQYKRDNPLTNQTKDYDMSDYQKYNDMITGNKPMTDDQEKWYQNIVGKWNLDDMNNPLVQQKLQMEKDKQAALAAQDSALNNSMATMDANNFQQFMQLQQDMSNRGMGDSGIASDAYTRLQMGANRDYQDAFVAAQKTKSDIQANYTNEIGKVGQAIQEGKDAKEAQDIANQTAAQKEQFERDKYLTTSTGVVYVNGKPLMYKGKPVTTLEYQKLSETQRHNLASENNVKNGQSLDYALGLQKDETARMKINADVQKALASMKLDYAKLDYNYAKLESSNAIAQDKIRIAADNAQTSKDKAAITALGKQLSTITSQITAYQKQGKKPPKALVDKYNSVNNSLNALMGK